ncbi:conserved hypothetical protein [Ricinus communis]|uniref:Tyr recombinase domain-containing protein n=1 Tax=Ricinus communis TaxID=3988 RepID=B9T8A9_RICCO|nr:conserved hypothetical protein [Ricinus communis]
MGSNAPSALTHRAEGFRSGRLHRRTRGRTGNVYATEDSTTGAVRDHGADPAEYRGMDTARGLKPTDYLFPSRLHASPHMSTRQYARIVHRWVASIGLDDAAYGTHTMRRTKASLIYRRTRNLRAVQLLLGHTKLESTVRYLGIEVDDALELAEQTEV